MRGPATAIALEKLESCPLATSVSDAGNINRVVSTGVRLRPVESPTIGQEEQYNGEDKQSFTLNDSSLPHAHNQQLRRKLKTLHRKKISA